MEEARDDPSLETWKVRCKKEVILEAQRDKKKVHVALLMDMRGQEQTSDEGSAVAKPKPMSHVQAKAKPRNLVSQVSHSSNRWSEKSTSATALSNPEIPEKAMTQTARTDTSNIGRHRKMLRAQRPGNKKRLFLLTVASGNGSEQRTLPTEMKYCSMKITDYSYLSKVFMFLQQQKGVQKGCETFGIQASKTNIMMWRLFVSSSMRAAIHLGLNHEENLETYKLMNFDQIQSVFNITKFFVMEHSQ